MIQIISEKPISLKKFISEFRQFFSNPTFVSFSIYLSGLFLELKRTNINSIVDKTPSAQYQNIQYFLSESKWKLEDLNTHRLALLQANPATRATKRGVLVIDDSSCKKWGFATQGVGLQYSSTEEKTINCNVVVTSAYADKKKRYPIDLRPYIPKDDSLCKSYEVTFKTKHELAKELVEDAVKREIPFKYVVFDNWYFSSDFVTDLNISHLKWITEAEKNRLISYKGKWVRADEPVKLIPCTKFNRTVTLTYIYGKDKRLFLYAFRSKIHGLDGEYLVVIAVSKWNDGKPEDVHVFVTNDLTLDPAEVVKKYAMRWEVECIFKDLKDNVAFDHYQVRSIKAITRHWHLSVLAYTFLLRAKATGSIARSLKSRRIRTIGDALRGLRTLNNVIAIEWIKNHSVEFSNYAGLKNPIELAA